MKESRIKYRFLSAIYKEEYLEYYFLDDALELTKERVILPSKSVWGKTEMNDRVFGHLIKDGYIEENSDGLRITSEGLLFLGAGGYTSRFLHSKRANWTFWISILSFVIASTSFVISMLK